MTQSAVDPSASGSVPRRDGATGALVLGAFGALWLFLGLRALWGSERAWGAAALVAGGALVLLGVGRLAPRRPVTRMPMADHSRLSRRFRLINIVQWAAIIAWIAFLNVIQHVEWIIPGIMLIVGLHFLPLARLFAHPSHYLTGGALCLLALSYPFLSAQGPAHPLGPILAGLILWAAALHLLLKPSRRTG